VEGCQVLRVVLLGSFVFLSSGCVGAYGDWRLNIWGERFIERQINARLFEDECEVVYDSFFVVVTDRQLRDERGTTVVDVGRSHVYDLTMHGPHVMAAAATPSELYDRLYVTFAPDPDAVPGNAGELGAQFMLDQAGSLWTSGTITCPSGTVSFLWDFDHELAYECEPPALQVAYGTLAQTELTVRGDYLFRTDLDEPAAAPLRATAFVTADLDGDGVVTLEDLAGLTVEQAGLEVGDRTDVVTVADFLVALTEVMVAVDSEGVCTVPTAD
jgi:hypothetical protein